MFNFGTANAIVFFVFDEVVVWQNVDRVTHYLPPYFLRHRSHLIGRGAWVYSFP